VPYALRVNECFYQSLCQEACVLFYQKRGVPVKTLPSLTKENKLSFSMSQGLQALLLDLIMPEVKLVLQMLVALFFAVQAGKGGVCPGNPILVA